jgi:hypothetical protein
MLLIPRTRGLALSNAVKSVIVRSTVVFISVRKNAMLKIVPSLIVHVRRMWFYAVRAERHHCLGLKGFFPGHPARIAYLIARNPVVKPYLAGIFVL